MMNLRHAFYLSLGLTALILTWGYGIAWIREGGDILDPTAFFGEPIRLGGTAAFLSIDMLFTWFAFMIWVVTDSRRIGLGTRWGLAFLMLSIVAVSFAFPVYLIVRERFIVRVAGIKQY